MHKTVNYFSTSAQQDIREGHESSRFPVSSDVNTNCETGFAVPIFDIQSIELIKHVYIGISEQFVTSHCCMVYSFTIGTWWNSGYISEETGSNPTHGRVQNYTSPTIGNTVTKLSTVPRLSLISHLDNSW